MSKLASIGTFLLLLAATASAQNFVRSSDPASHLTTDPIQAQAEQKFNRDQAQIRKRAQLLKQVAVGWTVEELLQAAGNPDHLQHGRVGDHYEGIASYRVPDGMVIVTTRDRFITEIQRPPAPRHHRGR